VKLPQAVYYIAR